MNDEHRLPALYNNRGPARSLLKGSRATVAELIADLAIGVATTLTDEPSPWAEYRAEPGRSPGPPRPPNQGWRVQLTRPPGDGGAPVMMPPRSFWMGSGLRTWKPSARRARDRHAMPFEPGRGGERVSAPNLGFRRVPEDIAEFLRQHTEPAQPTAYDVLSSLLSDSQSVEAAPDFQTWADDLGLDSDSRKAESTYHECHAIRRDLLAFLCIDGAQLYDIEDDGDAVPEWTDEDRAEARAAMEGAS